MSAAQLGLWFAQKIDPANPIYNLGQSIEIHGSVDPSLFEAAIKQAVIDTEACRVRFIEEIDDGDLLFFAAVEDSLAPPTDAWRPYVRGQITIRQIACRHTRMIQPRPIAQIGQALAVELEKRRNSQSTQPQTERPEL